MRVEVLHVHGGSYESAVLDQLYAGSDVGRAEVCRRRLRVPVLQLFLQACQQSGMLWAGGEVHQLPGVGLDVEEATGTTILDQCIRPVGSLVGVESDLVPKDIPVGVVGDVTAAVWEHGARPKAVFLQANNQLVWPLEK